MTNPHDAPSPHSRKWDEEERRSESNPYGSSSGGYGSSGYGASRPPTDWSRGTGRSPYEKRGRGKKAAGIIISIFALVLLAVVFGGMDSNKLPNMEIPKEISDVIILPDQTNDVIEIPTEKSDVIEVPASGKSGEILQDYKEQQIANKVHDLINKERQARGLSVLSLDVKLSKIAHLHSIDMYNRNYFAHDTPDGLDPTDRAKKGGYSCAKWADGGIGENLWMVEQSSITFWNDPDHVANDAVNGWMDSPGHKKNILTKEYDREGIGVKVSTFSIYITQNFC